MPGSATAGSDIIDMRLNISPRRVLASSEAVPSSLAIPDTVDGSVPATVIIAVRNSGSGRSPPRVTSMFCIAI